MPVIRKTFGEFPFQTVVNTTEVHFDAEGLADVEQEIFDALVTVPGFEAHEANEASEDGEEESEAEDEQSSEEETTEEAPTPKPRTKRPSIKR